MKSKYIESYEVIRKRLRNCQKEGVPITYHIHSKETLNMKSKYIDSYEVIKKRLRNCQKEGVPITYHSSRHLI